MTERTKQNKNVLEASKERIKFVFDRFEEITLSFSGGKDSSVMMHLVAQEAKKRKRKVGLLMIDLEAQYKKTIDHALEMVKKYENCFEVFWVSLPIHLRNAVSVFEPQWVCFEPSAKNKWVRSPPSLAITDQEFFPFYKYAMEFEDFVVEFDKWYSTRNGGSKKLTASFVGIRTQESLNRWKAIHQHMDCHFLNKKYLNKVDQYVINVYPIFDWKTEDIWKAVGDNEWEYNKIYDEMYQSGRSINDCRICQPYGDDQRKGLDLFRQCEPETWEKVVTRVSGANYGNIYCNTELLGNRKVVIPPGMTWRKYLDFLLDTIPLWQKMWYKHKFKIFMDNWDEKFEEYISNNIYKYGEPIQNKIKVFAERWRNQKHIPVEDRILDEEDRDIERIPLAPSYRRMAKTVYKNDLVCFELGHGRTSNLYYILQSYREKYGE